MTLLERPGHVVARPAPVRRRLAVVAGGLAVGVAGLGYVGVTNPHDPAVPMPVCPWRALTGLDCPGCGGLRMTHDLLHGEIGRAFGDNAVLLVLAPLLLFLLGRAAVRWVRAEPVTRRGPFEVRGVLGVTLAVVGIAWAVVRNLA